MNLLNRLKNKKPKTITIPGSDETIQVRSLSVREMEAYESAVKLPDVDHIALLLKLLIVAVINADGSPAWAESDKESLRDLPLSTVRAVAEGVIEYSGIDPDSKKSSGKTPASDLPTDSASLSG